MITYKIRLKDRIVSWCLVTIHQVHRLSKGENHVEMTRTAGPGVGRLHLGIFFIDRYCESCGYKPGTLEIKYYWRLWLGWFPIQPCCACQRWYWGGLPFGGWQAAYQEYCSKKCYEAAEY